MGLCVNVWVYGCVVERGLTADVISYVESGYVHLALKVIELLMILEFAFRLDGPFL